MIEFFWEVLVNRQGSVLDIGNGYFVLFFCHFFGRQVIQGGSVLADSTGWSDISGIYSLFN